jgi:CRISPR/Cas system CMR-associated protein Cmr5 small subunit
MINKKFFLSIKCATFYSYTDEDLFFDWIKKIPSIIYFEGVGKNLLFYFKSKRIKAQDLRELVALFRRYKIDMSELEIFLNEKNKELFYGGEHINVYPQKVIQKVDLPETQ